MTANGLLRDLALAAAAFALLLVVPAAFPNPALVDFIIYVAAYGLLAMFVMMAMVLILRPSGLFGRQV